MNDAPRDPLRLTVEPELKESEISDSERARLREFWRHFAPGTPSADPPPVLINRNSGRTNFKRRPDGK